MNIIANEERLKFIDEGCRRTEQSWMRALGGRLLGKRHLIDALVVTTERLNKNDGALIALSKEMLEDFERANLETVIMGHPITPVDFMKYIVAIKAVTLP